MSREIYRHASTSRATANLPGFAESDIQILMVNHG
jgi:HSP20 family molecular chaperone IbpA